MNKLLTVGTALMLLSTSAFASKARLIALGEDKDGSYFVSDYRNLYINPSEINSLGNLAVVEWGSNGRQLLNSSKFSLDADNEPKAQGGVVYGLSNGLKLGVILGDETDVAALTRALSSNSLTAVSTQFLQTADNVLDVFVGGSAAVNWGANLLYTQSKSEVTGSRYSQNAIATRLGVNSGAWNAHLLLALGAKADAPDNTQLPTYKGKFGARLGGGYDLSSEGKIFAMYENYSWKQDNNVTDERTGSFMKGFVGYGHQKKVNESGTLFAKGMVEVIGIKLSAVTGLVQAKIDRMAVPLTFGYEHSATDWLTLRGSVVQNLWGTIKDAGLQANFGTAGAGTTGALLRNLASARYGSSTNAIHDSKSTLANSTSVNAGATLKFGSVEVDGLIGSTTASRSAGTVAAVANTNGGVLALDNLETRVAVTYKF